MIVMTTYDARSVVQDVSMRLLDRHWPNHPELHVVSSDSWPRGLASFLRNRTEPVLLLMLDDYALCGKPNQKAIDSAWEFMTQNADVGAYYLQPKSGEKRRINGEITLLRPRLSLQAAIWRREWLIELLDQIPDQCVHPAYFEAALHLYTQNPRTICVAEVPGSAWIGGHFPVDGFDKTHWPLPYHNLMHRGKWDTHHAVFLRSNGVDVPLPPPPIAADPMEAYRRLWRDLHERAASPIGLCEMFLSEFEQRLPCGDCRRHWREWVAANPIEAGGEFAWTVGAHNAVNRRLGKAEMSVGDATMIYRA